MKTFSLIQCALRVLVMSIFAISFVSQAALVGRDLDGSALLGLVGLKRKK